MNHSGSLTYHRPRTLDEALDLLSTGVPLAGGTVLTPDRRKLQAVIDLADLGLEQISVSDDAVEFGAAVRLQALMQACQQPLPALAEACRREAGRNMRNQATLMGAICSGDARSPLLTALLAINPVLSIEPGSQQVELDSYLDERQPAPKSIATRIDFEAPAGLSLQQVGRSPLDRPQLIAAAAAFKDGSVAVAIGGHGDRPQRLVSDLANAQALAASAAQAYADAGDKWASAAYRSAAVAALVQRVVDEVVAT